MKLCNKKIYCAHCGTLVRCKEQKTNGAIKVSCNKCGTTLYAWEGTSWRPAPETDLTAAAPLPRPQRTQART